jgi:hypothetical protein
MFSIVDRLLLRAPAHVVGRVSRLMIKRLAQGGGARE